MVKLIALDIDGVIVGHKPGINFPYPHLKVIEGLKKVRQKGIPIVLCSGKYHTAVIPIVQKAELTNPHITDGGSFIINPIEKNGKSIISLNNQTVSDIIETCLLNKIHIEAFTEEDFFTQTRTLGIIEKRSRIFQKKPVIVDSLAKIITNKEVMRLTVIANNRKDRRRIEKVLDKFADKATFTWTTNPSTDPWEFCIITSTNASKATAIKQVAETLEISLEDTLGVGDTLGDWGFMKLCGYAGTLDDAEEELKQEVKTKGEGKYFIGPSVDEDGILDIIKYFLK